MAEIRPYASQTRFTQPAAGAAIQALDSILSRRISLNDFTGADPTGATFSDTALANAIAAAGSNGIIYVDLPGTYKFQTPIVKPVGIPCFSIIGINFRSVTFDYSAIAGGYFINLNGGSGSLTSAVFEGINFLGAGGANTTRAFELRGQDNVRWYRCRFDCKLTSTIPPILLHNFSAGQFTEFNVVEESEFSQFSQGALEYKVTAGNDSFHASGILHCLLHSGNAAAVIIGAGCRVYNAPMFFNNFANQSSSVFINNSALPCYFYGALNIETDGEIYTTITSLCSTNGFYFAGTINSLSSLNFGSVVQCLGVESSGPEFGNLYQARPVASRRKYFALTSGQAVGNVASYAPDVSAAMVSIQFFASGYSYRYYAYAEHNGFASPGIWTVLATGFINNSTAWGAPTITINASGDIIVTNAAWPANTVQCAVSIMPVTGSYTNYF